jgi:hypothetical protein
MTELPVLTMLDGDSQFDMLKIAPDLRLDGANAENFDSVRRDYMDIRGGTCGYKANTSDHCGLTATQSERDRTRTDETN